MPRCATIIQAGIMESARSRPPELYAAQREGVRRFLTAPSGRLLLCYGTGCGKTPTAISCLTQHWAAGRKPGLPRVLVVCPAMVRRHWAREFVRWANVRCALPIEMGRNAKGGTKSQRAMRDAAYASQIQITSYDLMAGVEAEGWDYLVFDEIHHLGDPRSQQSRRAYTLLKRNPGVHVLGLSATLIPTNLQQVWNPLRLLFGENEWGRPARTGAISWQFADRYCGITRNDYGCSVGKGIAERLPELRERIGQVAHQIQRRDIAADMPALNLRVLEQSDGEPINPPGTSSPPSQSVHCKYALQWLKELGSDITHTVILLYHRDKALALAQQISGTRLEPTSVFHIDGSMPTSERDRVLAQCEQTPRATLVATSESLREGIRLMWAQQVLFAEWRQSPAQVIQVLGRFQSVGDPRRPMVDLLVDPGMHTEAQRLVERIETLNSVLETESVSKELPELLRPRALGESDIVKATMAMLATMDLQSTRDTFSEETETEFDD